jgi:hypothetical protein
MEINDIDLIKAHSISEKGFKSKLVAYWVDKTTNRFYHYDEFISSELYQDLRLGTTTIEDVMVYNLKDCKEVSHQEMIEKFEEDERIKKYITAYIRDEKLNKLI